MNIAQFITNTTAKLTAVGINTARLDTLVLLCDELDCDKAWILAHDDYSLSPDQIASLRSKVGRRSNREPLAYIRGKQEFYGHDFTVTPDVLIPRPETEKLIELLLDLQLPDDANVIDVGTGSGAIAISAKLAQPALNVYATDISSAARGVASKNATQLGADVTFSQSNLLSNPPEESFDCVISNLPYVDPAWNCSPETSYEPDLALFAGDNGLELIKKLIRQAYSLLPQTGRKGCLILEADPRQLDAICNFATSFALCHDDRPASEGKGAKLVSAKNNGFSVQYAQDYSLVLAKD